MYSKLGYEKEMFHVKHFFFYMKFCDKISRKKSLNLL